MLALSLLDTRGIHWIFRWWHVVFGVAWIGLLYYFNFVQVPSFPTMEAPHRNGAIDKLVPRALWYFRYAALATFVTGIVMLGLYSSGEAKQYVNGYGTAIWAGSLIGTLMLVNVWFIIWPNQKVVIENARGLLGGKEANPATAASGRKALLASRTNAILSVPMLMFMTGAQNFFAERGIGSSIVFWIVLLVLVAILEANALGLIGGMEGPLTKQIAGHPRQIFHLAVPVAIILLATWIISAP
jgi:uncharacterized membrane protein